MTEDKITVLLIKGTIVDLPPEHKKIVDEAYGKIRAMINEHPIAAMAVALIGAELAASNE